MADPTAERCRKALKYYGSVYPGAWHTAEDMRTRRGKELPWWPSWCYLPLSGAYAIVSAAGAKEFHTPMDDVVREYPQLGGDIGVLGALAAWRVSQGIYRFDPDVYAAVVDTPLVGDVPHDVLFALPEWCCYIETPELSLAGPVLMHGFYVHLEYDANTTRKELRFVLDLDGLTAELERPFLQPVPLHLGPWSLRESVDRGLAESVRQASQAGENPFSPGSVDEMGRVMAKVLQPMVSLVLYLCSANGEVGSEDNRPRNPVPVKTKKGRRIFPPQEVKVWSVGERMGAVIRRDREKVGPGQVQDERPDAVGRARPRAHVRRAHWHGYWTGPRDAGDRKFVLHWLPPVLVAADGDGEMPVTVHPVN